MTSQKHVQKTAVSGPRMKHFSQNNTSEGAGSVSGPIAKIKVFIYGDSASGSISKQRFPESGIPNQSSEQILTAGRQENSHQRHKRSNVGVLLRLTVLAMSLGSVLAAHHEHGHVDLSMGGKALPTSRQKNRVIDAAQCVTSCNWTQYARTWVSTSKKRFANGCFGGLFTSTTPFGCWILGGTDLDAAYITPRIIAMGYPFPIGEGTCGYYAAHRNTMSDTRHFLNSRHSSWCGFGKKNYTVVNLCSERRYSDSCCSGFKNQIYFPFDDHNVPRFDDLILFLNELDEFMAEDTKNVVAFHCKAGKGRTGMLSVIYLIRHREGLTALTNAAPTPATQCCITKCCGDEDLDEVAPLGLIQRALTLYAQNRIRDNTKNRDLKGVTIPSQKRYIMYYDTWEQMGGRSPSAGRKWKLTTIIVEKGLHVPPWDYFSIKSFCDDEIESGDRIGDIRAGIDRTPGIENDMPVATITKFEVGFDSKDEDRTFGQPTEPLNITSGRTSGVAIDTSGYELPKAVTVIPFDIDCVLQKDFHIRFHNTADEHDHEGVKFSLWQNSDFFPADSDVYETCLDSWQLDQISKDKDHEHFQVKVRYQRI